MGVSTAAFIVTPQVANDNETTAAFLLDIRGQVAALAALALSANNCNPLLRPSNAVMRWRWQGSLGPVDPGALVGATGIEPVTPAV